MKEPHTPGKKPLAQFVNNQFDAFRHSLAYFDALPQLTLLGLLIGLSTGAIIVLFRMLIDTPLGFLIGEHSDNFESLSASDRILFIFAGILIIAFIIKLAGAKHSEVGVAHVLNRLHNHQGKMPITNWLVQFACAVVALISGQSVGREGPAVHLGAGVASQLGQWLKLPNNSMLTLVGCGVAAAISASFNTPMAGVIFAMEVIVLEYTIVGFVPVILASVMGTMISRAAFGDSSGLLVMGSSDIQSLTELPYMMVVGMVISVCAAIYIRLNIFALKFTSISIYHRLLIAGALTTAVAVFIPQIMGLGYDTLNAALTGQLLIETLVIIAIAKLIVTPIVIGLGIPGGVIGPLLVIGACIGGALGLAIQMIFPELETDPAFYVVIGMTAMMAATLNAPLAALVAVLELSYNPNIIFPAMLVIVVACVCTRQFFKLDSIFVLQLRHSGRDLDTGPARQALRRAGVRSIMDTRFTLCPQFLSMEDAAKKLETKPMWLVFENENTKIALRAADLAAAVNEVKASQNTEDTEHTEATPSNSEQTIDLLEIRGRRHNLNPIHDTANLLEAMDYLETTGSYALYVSKTYSPLSGHIHGIITMAAIENYYQPKEFRNANAVD